jgi:hypothetical protein
VVVYLVCEGPRGGLDDRVLDAIVVNTRIRPLTRVRIETAGGSKGHGAVRYYLENRLSPPQDVAIAVEDRDYRLRKTADDSWMNPVGTSLIWRRHEIENYLLHPRVVLELFNDFRAAGAAWANTLPAAEADVAALLRTLASPLLEDHAAEVLREEMVQQINAIGSLSFGPARPAPATGLPAPGQAEWLPVLQQEAARLGRTCTDVAALPGLQPAAIAARYAALLTRCQDPAFLTSDEYLNDIGGKELLAALSRHLHKLGALASSINRNVLADELLRVLVPIYQPDSIYQPDDFAELATILRQY